MNREIVSEMLQRQDDLNKNICGENWRNGVTDGNRKIFWARAIYMEIAELIDSFPWKHWKDIDGTEPDLDNAVVELIDIWHFYMSAIFEYAYQCMGDETTQYPFFMIERAADVTLREEPIKNLDDAIMAMEEIMMLASQISIQKRLTENNYKTKSEYCAEAGDALIKIGAHLLLLFSFFNVDVEKAYEGKRVLNEFRQEMGYKKSGKYKKVWAGGKEDNVYMMSLLRKMSIEDIRSGRLKEALAEIYRKTV